MKLEAINAVAQLIAAFGVIASLFYLAAQIRQNTRSQRSVVVDSLTHSLIDLLGPQASDPDQMRAFVSVTEDWHGATEADRLRAVSTLFTMFKVFENAWFQRRQGTLDAEQWEAWDLHIRVYYHRPGVTFAGAVTPGRLSFPRHTRCCNEKRNQSRMLSRTSRTPHHGKSFSKSS